MDAQATGGFLRFFSDLPDPRAANCIHKLSDIFAEVAASSADGDVQWQQAAITGLADGIRSGPLAAANISPMAPLLTRAPQSTKDNLLNLIRKATSTAQDNALPRSGALANQLNLAQLQAGQVAVTGPGVTVTLREPAAATASPTPGRGGRLRPIDRRGPDRHCRSRLRVCARCAQN